MNDEINSRLFMMCPRDDIGYCLIGFNIRVVAANRIENSRGFTLINAGRISSTESALPSAFIRGFDLRETSSAACCFLKHCRSRPALLQAFRPPRRHLPSLGRIEFNPVSGDDLAPFELWGLASVDDLPAKPAFHDSNVAAFLTVLDWFTVRNPRWSHLTCARLFSARPRPPN